MTEVTRGVDGPTELLQAAEPMIRRVARRTAGGAVEFDDISQQLALWVHTHPVKVREWLDEGAVGKLIISLKRESWTYSARERAKMGVLSVELSDLLS